MKRRNVPARESAAGRRLNAGGLGAGQYAVYIGHVEVRDEDDKGAGRGSFDGAQRGALMFRGQLAIAEHQTRL